MQRAVDLLEDLPAVKLDIVVAQDGIVGALELRHSLEKGPILIVPASWGHVAKVDQKVGSNRVDLLDEEAQDLISSLAVADYGEGQLRR